MVGRTPEYLGKKIQSSEMKLVVLYILAVPLDPGLRGHRDRADERPDHSLLRGYCQSYCAHGLTEMVYTYTSAANNNGSAFAGLSANTQWFNTTLGIVMLVGPVPAR